MFLKIFTIPTTTPPPPPHGDTPSGDKKAITDNSRHSLM